MTDIQQTLHTLSRMVGFTPLLALDIRYRGEAGAPAWRGDGQSPLVQGRRGNGYGAEEEGPVS